jgi:hypothetical protein
MTSQETSDITRGLHALRRLWWVPLLAVVAGAALAVGTSTGDDSATFEGVVATPALDTQVLEGAVSAPQLEILIARLHSPETTEELGASVTGVASATTIAPDRTSVSVRGTATDVEAARDGTAAYAGRLAALYQDFVSAEADRVLRSLDGAIDELESASRDRGDRSVASTLAKLKVQRGIVADLANAEPQTPDVHQISSAGRPTAAVLLLALAFGVLAAGVVALGGLSRRRVRYRDDVEAVTGMGTLLSEVSLGRRANGAGQVLTRLAQAGTVTLVPVGQRPLDDVREALIGDAAGDVVVAEPGATVGGEAGAGGGPTVLVVRLGTDTASDLDLAHRESSAAGGSFAGVIAVTDGGQRAR